MDVRIECDSYKPECLRDVPCFDRLQRVTVVYTTCGAAMGWHRHAANASYLQKVQRLLLVVVKRLQVHSRTVIQSLRLGLEGRPLVPHHRCQKLLL